METMYRYKYLTVYANIIGASKMRKFYWCPKNEKIFFDEISKCSLFFNIAIDFGSKKYFRYFSLSPLRATTISLAIVEKANTNWEQYRKEAINQSTKLKEKIKQRD